MTTGRRGEWHEWPFEPIEVFRTLGRYGVEYVLLGGLAAVLQGSPLPTYDIDIAPAPGEDNLARLHAALVEIGATQIGHEEGAAGMISPTAGGTYSSSSGYIDVHPTPAGFPSYAAVLRNARHLQLEPGLSLLAAPVRDIIVSRLAAGDQRQLPALEAVLEVERAQQRSLAVKSAPAQVVRGM